MDRYLEEAFLRKQFICVIEGVTFRGYFAKNLKQLKIEENVHLDIN